MGGDKEEKARPIPEADSTFIIRVMPFSKMGSTTMLLSVTPEE